MLHKKMILLCEYNKGRPETLLEACMAKNMMSSIIGGGVVGSMIVTFPLIRHPGLIDRKRG